MPGLHAGRTRQRALEPLPSAAIRDQDTLGTNTIGSDHTDWAGPYTVGH